MSELSKEQIQTLRESRLDLAWDCASGWIGDGGVDTWSDQQVVETSKNIKESLPNV